MHTVLDLPGGRGEMNSAIETGSDIYLSSKGPGQVRKCKTVP